MNAGSKLISFITEGLPWKITGNNWSIQKKTTGPTFQLHKKERDGACVPVRLEPCFGPINVIIHHRDREKAHPCVNPRLLSYQLKNPLRGLTCTYIYIFYLDVGELTESVTDTHTQTDTHTGKFILCLCIALDRQKLKTQWRYTYNYEILNLHGPYKI